MKRIIYQIANYLIFSYKKIRSRVLSSKHWPIQVVGYIFCQLLCVLFFLGIGLLLMLLLIGIESLLEKLFSIEELWCATRNGILDFPFFTAFSAWITTALDCIKSRIDGIGPIGISALHFGISTFIFLEVIWIVRKLTPIFSIRREEIKITVSQICILIAFGCWLLSIILILREDCDIKLEEDKYALLLGAVGALMAWIFQDTIRSVVAFLYVRFNGMLNIGDWIKVDSKNIDGMVKSITLTMVTVENWDTTETSFPTNILHSDSFTNLQSMLDGKTHGRRMLMTFTIDTGWIQPISVEEAVSIAKRLDTDNYFKESEFVNAIKEAEADGVQLMNIHMFRLYIFHWLMNHHKVCRRPRLVVRYLQPTADGLPMQVYAYLTDISLEPFEWTQSAIVEHIIESMKWFNLRLFQNASAFDVSNSNIYLAPETAEYKNYCDETSK